MLTLCYVNIIYRYTHSYKYWLKITYSQESVAGYVDKAFAPLSEDRSGRGSYVPHCGQEIFIL